MPLPPSRIAFGDFLFDPASGELWRDSAVVPLQPQPSRLLALLLARPGEMVSRDQIRQALWGSDTHVDFDRSLNFCVAKLRAALNDSAAEPRFIETLPTRGYRFLEAAVKAPAAAMPPPPAQPDPPPPALADAPPSRSRTGYVVSAALLVAAIAILVMRVAPVGSGAPTVVVVPFHNETGSPDLDRVAKGVSDAAVVKLAEAKQLRVIGNASGVTFSFRPPDMKQMGESLGAQYLVLGQMKRDARRMRIVAHLIRVSDQTHVWASTYDADSLDLAQQSTIGNEIAAAVRARLGKS